MKYLKSFETINQKPKIGDFIICDKSIADWYKYKDTLNNIISTNIGTVKNVARSSFGSYSIKYDNISEDEEKLIIDYCKDNDWTDHFIKIDFNDIQYWSNDKKELEILINANKYNL